MKILLHLFLVAVFTLPSLSLCRADSIPVPDETERVTTLEDFFAPPADKVISTADSIVVKGVKTKQIKGFLKVDFKLRNNRGRRNVINYRVQWLDNDGVMMGEYGAWLTVAFEGQQEITVTATAPMNNAVDYRLELQSN